MGDVDLIMIVTELQIEAKDVVVSASLLLSILVRVLVVADILTISMPTVVNPLCFLPRVDERKHSIVIHRVRFLEISNVEGVGPIFSGISDPKEEPLCIAVSIKVRF